MNRRYYVHPNDLHTEPWHVDDPEDAAVVVAPVARAEAAEAHRDRLVDVLEAVLGELELDSGGLSSTTAYNARVAIQAAQKGDEAK